MGNERPAPYYGFLGRQSEECDQLDSSIKGESTANAEPQEKPTPNKLPHDIAGVRVAGLRILRMNCLKTRSMPVNKVKRNDQVAREGTAGLQMTRRPDQVAREEK